MIDEAAATLWRTSFSTLVRESNDYAVVLTDVAGHSLAQSTASIPPFIGTLPRTVQHFVRLFPPESLRPGDVLTTNDPWLATGHIHDINVCMPIFRRGRPVAMVAACSHVPDIGGRLRGAGIREIFEEGLQIPPLYLMREGRPDPAVVAFIEKNVRVPEQTMGDVWAQVSACRMMERSLGRLLDETDLDIAAFGREVRARSEAAMRAAIRAIPNGVYRARWEIDVTGEPLALAAKVTVRDQDIAVDFTGSAPQVPRSVNVTPSYTFAYTAFGLKCLLSPDIPNNDGSFRPITAWAPEGSILNPRYPAAGGARNAVGQCLPGLVMDALSGVIPDRVTAGGSLSCSFSMSGEHAGRRYAVVNFINGGQGAAAHRDGIPILSWPGNVGNTPIEVMETMAPIRVLRRARVKGSGGRGRHRGGDSALMEFEVVAETPAVLSFVFSRLLVAPPALQGGEPGGLARLAINGRRVASGEHHVVGKGDRVSMLTASGAGFGRPAGGTTRARPAATPGADEARPARLAHGSPGV
ncbi:MAG: hydantoinase B/oxoprolinase family protein [Proteobacteria bacterium]|nr:hydantoinase B/oxoprolinase family protein [Pseudomonadota bacterium]